MDLRSLKYFIAVLEAGSLSRAATSLYVAQPALTAQIKKLERELGAQLLERSHAGVLPTPAGTQLYQDARRLLSDAQAIRDRLRHSADSPEGSVTIAIPFLLAPLLIGHVLERLRIEYPRIRVFVLDGMSLRVQQAMLDRRADIGILVDAPRLEGVRCSPLATEALYVTGKHQPTTVPEVVPQDAGMQNIRFRHAATLPLVLQSRRYAIRQSVENAAAGLGLSLNIVHEHDSARVIRSLYLAGSGYTFTPACTLGDVPTQHTHWFRARVCDPEILRHYFLAIPWHGRLTPAAQAVLHIIREEVRQAVTDGRWEAALPEQDEP